MPANALTVSGLRSLDELVDTLTPGISVPIHTSISPGRELLEHISKAYRSRLWDFKLITGVAVASALVLLAGIALPQYEPMRSSDLYKQIAPLFFDDTLISGLNGAKFFGGFMLLIFAGMGIPVVLDALYARRQNRRADALSQDGFVFAADITQQYIMPSQVEEAASVIIKKGNSPSTVTYEEWWAVKPDVTAVAHFSILDELPRYVGEVVIVRGKLSTVPGSEDMIAKLQLDARLTGSIGGIMPMSGRVEGEAGGEVYSIKQFRLIDPNTGISAAFIVDAYMRDGKTAPPYVLKTSSSAFGIHPADPNRLMHALAEAGARGNPVTVLGRVDPSGQVHAERISIRDREAYFLSVYQPPPLLKSG